MNQEILFRCMIVHVVLNQQQDTQLRKKGKQYTQAVEAVEAVEEVVGSQGG